MLAVNHVTLATAATFGLSLYFHEPFFLPFILFVAFAALVPDIDHPKSEISNFFPGINKALPHRGITHSFLGVVIFAFGINFLLQKDGYFAIALVLASLIGVYIVTKIASAKISQLNNSAFDIIGRKELDFIIRGFANVMYIFLFMLLFLIWKDVYRIEIATLLTIGYIGHILGDIITKDGVPLLWPLSARPALKLFRTGGGFESILGLFLFGLNFWLVYKFAIQNDISSSQYWTNYLKI
jgi:inner membrane protein